MSITFYGGIETERGWDFVPCEDRPNVGEMNAREVLGALGYSFDDGALAPVPVDAFVTRCTNALRRFVGRRDPAIPAPPASERMTTFGRREGYVQDTVNTLLIFARASKDRGATHIYAG